MVSLIHHLPAPIIHCLLLQLKLSVSFSNGKAIRYEAVVCLALPGMNLEKGPDAFTDIAPAVRLDFATCTVFEKPLHLGTVGRGTLSGSACGGMQQ
jgi:hypothetical protein